MDSLLLTGGHILDPSRNFDAVADLLLLDGRVAACGDGASARAPEGCPTLDVTGKTVVPGLLDMHVHFREPGMAEEETIASGAAAAVAGGFTTVACMPNTDPALDAEADMHFVLRESKKAELARVLPVGAITEGRKGEALAEMANMARGGAVAFSDDGSAVPTTALLRQAMLYAGMLHRPILEHCEDESLAAGGAMHEGALSTILGLPGIPAAAESIIVARDIELARLTGTHLHLQHISTADAVSMIRRAKAEGVAVTAEVTPHHLTLTEEALRGYDTNFKVNPPLRPQSDVDACIEGLLDGTIDVIASDHAPHLAEEKEAEFAYAPCGMIGLETTLGVLLTDLVEPGRVPLTRILEAMTVAPARILGLECGGLSVGMPGDVTVMDMAASWRVDPSTFRSRSRNCPYRGRTLRGQAFATVVGGRVVFRRGEE